MHQLILIDDTSKLEIGRRDMVPAERYELYKNHMEHELLLFAGCFYMTHTVGWRLPEQDFVASVTFQANEMVYCDC
jgi:hypothetical protein